MSGALVFKRLRVENVGVIRDQYVDIGPLSTGINVISGPNECGKSSIVRALRAALFMRHGSAHESIKALRPYGSKAGPSVELAFAVDGRDYVLEKNFLSRPRSILRSVDGAVNLAGDEADTWLVTTFDALEAPKKGFNPDSMGVWGLLWVQQDQFAAGEPTKGLGEHQRGSLARAIEQQVGNVMGGEHGVRLRTAIDVTCQEFWTAATDRPTGKLLKARETVENLKTEVARLKHDVDETVALGREQSVAEQDIVDRKANEARLEREGVECERLAEEAREIARAHDAAVTARTDAREAFERATKARQRRSDLKAAVASTRERESARQGELDRIRNRESVAAQELERTELALGQAQRDVVAAQTDLDDVLRRLDVARRRAELTAKEGALTVARQREEEIRRCDQAIETLPDAKAFKTVQEMARRRADHADQMARHATRIKVTRSNGDAHEQLVARRMRIDLGDLGSVTLEPPREGFVQAREAYSRSSEALRQWLDALRVASVAEARAKCDRSCEADARLTARRAELKTVAPKGLDALVTEAQRAETDAARHDKALGDARELTDAALRHEQQIAALGITDAAVQRLVELENGLIAQERASAQTRVRVTVRSLAGVRVQWSEHEAPEVLSAGAEIQRPVTRPTKLTVDDCVAVVIDPGEADGDAGLDPDAARLALATALASMGLDAVADARSKLYERVGLESLREDVQRRLNELAPSGVGVLEDAARRGEQRVQKIKKALGEARRMDAEIAAAERAVAAEGMSPENFAKLDGMDRRAMEEERLLHQVGARIVATEGALRAVIPSGEDVVGACVWAVGDARIEIVPGEVSQDLELPVLERELHRALEKYGVATVDDLVRAHVRHESLQAEREQKIAELRRIEPRGVDQLEIDVARLRAVDDGTNVDEETAPLVVAKGHCERRLAEARTRLRETDAHHARARRDLVAVQAELSVARDAVSTLALERVGAETTLAVDENGADEIAIAEDLRRAVETLAGVEQRCDLAARALDAAMPEVRQRDVERTVRALDEHRRRSRALQDEYERRKGMLEAIMPQGRYDKLAESEAALEDAATELARVERVANAVKLLRDTAARGYGEAQQKLLAPVYAEAMPLLRQILPKTTFKMSEGTLALEKIHREGYEEDFDMLSGGTREQLGMVIRVALARVFAKQRRAMPLVLDDILGWTDDTRFRGMINVLESTAQEMQVILLTCHPDRFARFLGATTFDLERLKTPVAAVSRG